MTGWGDSGERVYDLDIEKNHCVQQKAARMWGWETRWNQIHSVASGCVDGTLKCKDRSKLNGRPSAVQELKHSASSLKSCSWMCPKVLHFDSTEQIATYVRQLCGTSTPKHLAIVAFISCVVSFLLLATTHLRSDRYKFLSKESLLDPSPAIWLRLSKKSADVYALWRIWTQSSSICGFLKSICVKIWSITTKVHNIHKEYFCWKRKKCKTEILNLLSVFFSR